MFSGVDKIGLKEGFKLTEIVVICANDSDESLVQNCHESYVVENGSLAFEHSKVILAGIERLKNKIEYTDIVFNMMPEYFTLGELQKVYEVILGKKLLDPAFRRIIKNKVIKTDKIKTGEGHRPSYLFKYRKQK